MNQPQRIDFAALAEAPRLRETRTLADPRRPGLALVIELEEPSPLTDFAAAALAKEVVQRYVTGDPGRNHPAFPFVIDGKEQELTPELIWDLCEIVALQPKEWSLPFGQYDFEEIATLAFKSRAIYTQLRAFARAMYRNAVEPLPNVPADPTPASV